MHDQQQHMLVRGDPGQRGTQHRPGLQVERQLGLLPHPFGDTGGGHRDNRQGPLARRGINDLLRYSVAAVEPGPQALVPGHQRRQRGV